MLKILLVTNLFPNQHEPTRGIFTDQIVDNLKLDHDVQVMAPTPWFPKRLARVFNRKHATLPHKTTHKGTTVYHPCYLVIPKIARWSYGIFFFLGIFNTLRKIKKEFNPDVINVHWMYPDAYGTVLAAKLLNIPVVTHSLGCDINEFANYPSRRFFIKKALQRADFNISVSEELKLKTIELGSKANKSTAIMNGVNSQLFYPQNAQILRNELDLPMDKRLLLFAGNFNIEKGLIVLLEAFAKVHDSFSDVQLVVVGSGPLESQIFAAVNELGIQDKVLFKGRVSHDQIPRYLSAVDFLCLPSLREGCPNIVLESLSSGTPVLSSRVGAVPEMLASQSQTLGLMASPGDAHDFSRIISQALDMDWSKPLNFTWMSWKESADEIGAVLQKVANKAA